MAVEVDNSICESIKLITFKTEAKTMFKNGNPRTKNASGNKINSNTGVKKSAIMSVETCGNPKLENVSV